jgi:hypothetical protein
VYVPYLRELHPLAVEFDGQLQLRLLLVQHLDQVFSLKETTQQFFNVLLGVNFEPRWNMPRRQI